MIIANNMAQTSGSSWPNCQIESMLVLGDVPTSRKERMRCSIRSCRGNYLDVFHAIVRFRVIDHGLFALVLAIMLREIVTDAERCLRQRQP